MSTLTVAGKTQAEKIRLMLTAAPALTPQTWAARKAALMTLNSMFVPLVRSETARASA